MMQHSSGLVVNIDAQPLYRYNCGHAVQTSGDVVIVDICARCARQHRLSVASWHIVPQEWRVERVGSVFLGTRELHAEDA